MATAVASFACRNAGLLQAMVPDTVAEGSTEQARMGISDWLNDGIDSKRSGLERWLNSGQPQLLTRREQADLEQLFIGGGGGLNEVLEEVAQSARL